MFCLRVGVLDTIPYMLLFGLKSHFDFFGAYATGSIVIAERMAKGKAHVADLCAKVVAYSKLRKAWTVGRRQRLSHAKLRGAFYSAAPSADAGVLRALVAKTRTARYRHRRRAPLMPEKASVLVACLGRRGPTPKEVLLASIRARIFAVAYKRAGKWHKPAAQPRSLPHHPFGQCVKRGFKEAFEDRLQKYRALAADPLFHVSRKAPVTMDVLRRRLGFASEAPWILSVVLNDVALISSFKCVRADRQWHRAQLSGGGVTWDGHPLIHLE